MATHLLIAGSSSYSSVEVYAPLGSIVLCLLEPCSLCSFSDALAARAQIPWCPVVVASPLPHPDEVMSRVSARGSPISAVRQADADTLPCPDLVRAAVAGRPLVTSSAFLDYLRHRLGDEVGRAAARVCVSSPDRRATRRLTSYPNGTWKRLWELVLAASLIFREQLSVEDVAFALDRCPRNVIDWPRLRAGMQWRDLRELDSWEAVCEAGLRKLGMVGADGMLPRRNRLSGEYLTVELMDQGDRSDLSPRK